MDTGRVLCIMFFLMAIIQIYTGKLITKQRSHVSRTHKPVIFWSINVLYLIAGIVLALGIGSH